MKVGPNFHRPCAPEKNAWTDTENAQIQITDKAPSHWWENFNDPTLNHLMEVATNQNLTLKIACYRIIESRARLGIAIGEFFPQIQEGFGSASRTKLSEHQANIGPIPDIYFKDYQLGLQTAWELDFWGKFRRAIESEQAELCSSIANYHDVQILLLSDVAAVYTGIRTIQERIAIVKNNIGLQKRSLEITNANFRGGFVSELDVQQATTLLRGTEARLPDLERQLRQTENALSVLLGIPPGQLCDLISEKGSIPIAPSEIFVNLPESLLYQRPDVRRALFDTASQSARIGVAFADFFPQLSLLGTIGYQSSNSERNPPIRRGQFTRSR